MKVFDVLESEERGTDWNEIPHAGRADELAHVTNRLEALQHRITTMGDKLRHLEKMGLIVERSYITTKKWKAEDIAELIGSRYFSLGEFFYNKNDPKSAVAIGKWEQTIGAMMKLRHELLARQMELTIQHKTFCFSGFRSAELEGRIKALGGRVVSSVTQDLSYLVVADIHSVSGKAEKARQIGVKIINKASLIKLLKDGSVRRW